MKEKEIKKIIWQYIAEETMIDPSKFKDETHLFEEGIFDSMGFLLLIEFIKEKFNVDTTDDELLLENFDSVNTISNFIISRIDQFDEARVPL
jgi:acyl carrier protein